MNETHVKYSNVLNNQQRYEAWLTEVSDASRTVIFGDKLGDKGEIIPRVSMSAWCEFPLDYTVKTQFNNEKVE